MFVKKKNYEINCLHISFQTSAGDEYLLVTPDNSLYFPAVDFLRSQVGKVGVKLGSRHLPVVIDCRYILGADFTAAKVFLFFHINYS